MSTENTDPQRIPLIQSKILNGILNGAQLPDATVDSLLASEGLRRGDLREAQSTLPFAVYLRLFDRIAGAIGRDSFGLELSAAMGPELVGAAGYIFVASPDLNHAVPALSSSVFTIQDATAFEVSTDPSAHVRYRITDDEMTPRRQDVEFSLGYVDRLVRMLLGPAYAPLEVWFEHPRRDRLGRHEAVFRCPVFFEQEMNAIFFRDEDMIRRGTRPDPNLVALMQHYVQLLDNRSHAITTFSEEVRQILATLPESGVPGLGSVLKQLGMSSATLGRRLAAEGTSFRDLARRHRIDRAARLLGETRLSILEVAARCGYAETASFSRAFREVTGTSPRAYRAEVAGQVAPLPLRR
ncbi:AraC family transcriptional regulator [Tropicibacter sp. S64]|uniref:AraC family transcriptional regulator n=1 Tax=Tropicibacter sp. S64 TaxID=3415122 RepID=UPI003C7D1FF2